jgi:hypothetical protein
VHASAKKRRNVFGATNEPRCAAPTPMWREWSQVLPCVAAEAASRACHSSLTWYDVGSVLRASVNVPLVSNSTCDIRTMSKQFARLFPFDLFFLFLPYVPLSFFFCHFFFLTQAEMAGSAELVKGTAGP